MAATASAPVMLLLIILSSTLSHGFGNIIPQDGSMAADKITALPGQPNGVLFEQYGGYVAISPTKALFYYFVESPKDPETKPLVMWFNGGPGASSLIGGLAELGPFRVNSDLTLRANEYTWTKEANIIFLEQPIGVGFSYTNNTDELNQRGDDQSAEDNYVFLLNWLERFPHYKNRDLYLAGESYAGHYVPQFADVIIKGNKNANKTIVNLTGIIVGNGLLSVSRGKGQHEFLFRHAIISDEMFDNFTKHCDGAKMDTFSCEVAGFIIGRMLYRIDPLNIYSPLVGNRPRKRRPISLLGVDEFWKKNLVSYMNLPEVQKALHANVTGIAHPWRETSSGLGGVISNTTITEVMKKIISSGTRVLLYSGDMDNQCPTPDTRLFIKTLGLPVEESWRMWPTAGEVGGYVVVYKGLTFATIRGAGHLVPQEQPERALTVFSSFLRGKFPSQ